MTRDVHAASKRDRRKARHSQAWLNGEEVTERCFYADDRRGVVGLYRLNAAGNKYVEDAQTGEELASLTEVYGSTYVPRVAREWRHGAVRIITR
jgi:hypothetical protein